MKRVILPLLLALVWGCMRSENYNGVVVYAEGSQTAYLLSTMPTVTYREGSAVLTVGGIEVTSVELLEGQQLVVTWGTYEESGIGEIADDRASVNVRREGKLLRGGRLIIVGRDGRLRNTSGRLIHASEAECPVSQSHVNNAFE